MAITSWSSEGMDWSSLTGKQLYPYAEALRLALLERGEIMGEVPSAELLTPITANTLPTAAWGQAFEFYLNDVARGNRHPSAPSVITHSWNNPNIELHGTSSNPIYDMDEILSYLGQNRLTVDVGFSFTAAWAKQQYDILNQLTRTQKVGTVIGVTTSGSERKFGSGTTFSDAETAFNAASWTTQFNNGPRYRHEAKDVGGSYEIVAVRGTGNVVTLPAPALPRTLSFYLYFTNPSISSPPYVPFDSGNLGIRENSYALVQQISTPFASSTVQLEAGFSITDNELADPGPGGFTGCFSLYNTTTVPGEAGTMVLDFTPALSFV